MFPNKVHMKYIKSASSIIPEKREDILRRNNVIIIFKIYLLCEKYFKKYIFLGHSVSSVLCLDYLLILDGAREDSETKLSSCILLCMQRREL